MQVYIRTPAFFISNTLTVILTAVIVPQKQQTQTDLFAPKVRLAPECYLLLLTEKKDLAMFELKKITKQYGQTTVLHETTLTVNDGEFFVLVGASGSGKTTLLKLLNRLIEPTSGTILRNGKPLHDLNLRSLRLDTGYVLQQIALFPNLTVGENIALVPSMKHIDKNEIRRRSHLWLEKTGLDPHEFMHRYPHELSGGQQQRVGIIRSLIGRPKVLLMDEPFSALDPLTRKQLQGLIKKIHQEFNLTVVFVTHDMVEASYLGTRLCIMDKGQIIQIDTAEKILRHPKNEFVRRLFEMGGDIDE